MGFPQSDIHKITSTGATVTVTNPTGPTTNLETGGGTVSAITSTGGTVTITNPNGPTTNLEVVVPVIPAVLFIATPITTNVAFSGSPVSIISLGAQTYTGAAVIFEFYCASLTLASAVGAETILGLYEDGSQVGIAANYNNITALGPMTLPLYFTKRFVPSAGSHTYEIKGVCSSGSATASAASGAGNNNDPITFRVRPATY